MGVKQNVHPVNAAVDRRSKGAHKALATLQETPLPSH